MSTALTLFSVLFVILFSCSQSLGATIKETSAEIGYDCEATGGYSTVMGYSSNASGDYSTAMGNVAVASGETSTAMGGHFSFAQGFASTVMGNSLFAVGYASTAMGLSNVAYADYSTIMGAGPEFERVNNDVPKSFMVEYRTSIWENTPDFLVKDEGVGINNKDPVTMLHVKQDRSGSASMFNHVAGIENTSTESSPDVLMLKLNIDNPTTASNFITFSGNTGNLGSIEGNGSGGIVLNTSGGDFAERLFKAEPEEKFIPGEIVGLFPDGIRKQTQNAHRLMVVTTSPAILGKATSVGKGELDVPVAFIGQVPVRITGPVMSGDYIVCSGRSDGLGKAVSPERIKPSQFTSIIGRALSSDLAIDPKSVLTLVGLPLNELRKELIKAKDLRIKALENRLCLLEATSRNQVKLEFLPGLGIIMGSVGLFWLDRRRKNERKFKNS